MFKGQSYHSVEDSRSKDPLLTMHNTRLTIDAAGESNLDQSFTSSFGEDPNADVDHTAVAAGEITVEQTSQAPDPVSGAVSDAAYGQYAPFNQL